MQIHSLISLPPPGHDESLQPQPHRQDQVVASFHTPPLIECFHMLNCEETFNPTIHLQAKSPTFSCAQMGFKVSQPHVFVCHLSSAMKLLKRSWDQVSNIACSYHNTRVDYHINTVFEFHATYLVLLPTSSRLCARYVDCCFVSCHEYCM